MSRYLEMLKTGKGPLSDPAKPAKRPEPNLAGFAGSSDGGFQKNDDAANDPPITPGNCVGALQSVDGGLYLPWGPYFDPESVNRMRAELVAMIEELAELEGWPEDGRDDMLARAIRGPLADLQPNLAHFRQRSAQFYAECEARRLARSRGWRADNDLTNRRY